MTAQESSVPLRTLTVYLEKRKDLISAREGLFNAISTYLHPEQRPDATLLGDPLALAKCRDISEAEFVVNAVRGYLVVMEAPSKGRMFRLSVLQQGNELRIGVSFDCSKVSAQGALPELAEQFSRTAPLIRKREGRTFIDWHFDARELYQSAQNFEDAVFKVGGIFELALHKLQAAE